MPVTLLPVTLLAFIAMAGADNDVFGGAGDPSLLQQEPAPPKQRDAALRRDGKDWALALRRPRAAVRGAPASPAPP